MRFYFSKFKNFPKLKEKKPANSYDFLTQQEKGNLFKVQNNHKKMKHIIEYYLYLQTF